MPDKLFEKYRPRTFDTVLGQEKAVRALLRHKDRKGFGGQAYWISAGSGQGKTSLALLIAKDIADDFYITEIDATPLTVSELERIENEMHYTAMGEKGGRAYIVNEAHGLKKPVIRQLLVVLERLPAHVVVIFTTTKDGAQSLFEDYDDASPLLSRCFDVPMTSKGLADVFAARALEIARAENMDGRPLQAYKRLAMDCRNNFRLMLSQIEAGCMLSE